MTNIKLLIELENDKFIFYVVELNDKGFKVLEKIRIKSKGLNFCKIVDLNDCVLTVQDSLFQIEKKLNHTFDHIILIIDNHETEIINVTGSKKLRGEQLSKQDISYIINSLQKQIIQNDPKKEIIHLFNTFFKLDGTEKKNLPLGMAGDFYSHQLTFLLNKKNDLKNLQILFRRCNLTIERFLNRNFLAGMSICNTLSNDSFFSIHLGKEKSNISFFYNGSFSYLENFSFGTNIIKKDISKLCLLELFTIDKILSEINFDQELDEKYLDKKFFNNTNYRKISLSHFKEIMFARLQELFDLILINNINISYLKSNIDKCLIFVEDQSIFNSLKKSLFEYLEKKEKNKTFIIKKLNQNDEYQICNLGVILIQDGWRREVLSITRSKKSLISRVFNSLFGG